MYGAAVTENRPKKRPEGLKRERMVTRKYLKDYRLEDSLDERGRLRTRAVYVGGDYVFSMPQRAGKRQRWTILLLNVACWLLFFGALLPSSTASYTLYCVLPFVACVLTLLYESAAVGSLMTAKEPLKREQADRLSGRLPTTALLTLIFSGVALGGCGVIALRAWGTLLWGDAVFAAAAALLAGASAAILYLARGFAAVKREE